LSNPSSASAPAAREVRVLSAPSSASAPAAKEARVLSAPSSASAPAAREASPMPMPFVKGVAVPVQYPFAFSAQPVQPSASVSALSAQPVQLPRTPPAMAPPSLAPAIHRY
jgi:hypothetical protein